MPALITHFGPPVNPKLDKPLHFVNLSVDDDNFGRFL